MNNKKIYIYVTVLCLSVGWAVVDYINKPSILHNLDCVLKDVYKEQLQQRVSFKREDVIRNGYVYNFKIFDDGLLLVDDSDQYILDNTMERTYYYMGEKNINKNLRYIFTDDYQDVLFKIEKIGVVYGYDCK